MLRRLARFSLRHRRLVALAWAVLFVAGIAIGSGVFERLDPDVGDVEGTESAVAGARLGASFGALVWVFQDGHRAGLLGVEGAGAIDPTVPVLTFAITFGLSMDYEVFLLSRIKEAWDETGDNDLAVALGLQRSGRIVTSAALLLVVVFSGFMAAGMLTISQVGLATVLAVLLPTRCRRHPPGRAAPAGGGRKRASSCTTAWSRPRPGCAARSRRWNGSGPCAGRPRRSWTPAWPGWPGPRPPCAAARPSCGA